MSPKKPTQREMTNCALEILKMNLDQCY